MTEAKLLTFFTDRKIAVGKIPAQVLARARQVIQRLERGEPYRKLQGKRLQSNRRIISIPLGRHWRILADDQQDQIIARAVLSHQKYNTSIHSSRRNHV